MMGTDWRNPGRTGAVTYAGAATALGLLARFFWRSRVRRVGEVEAPSWPRRDRLPEGPLIVVANHTSFADGAILALICHRLGRSARMLATAGVFGVPVLGGLLRRLGFIAVRRGTASARDSLASAEEALAAGELVALFPEGRITRDAGLWPERGKTGAVRLALRTGAPVLPIALAGAHEVVGRGRIVLSLTRSLLTTPRVAVLIGEPMDLRALAAESRDTNSPAGNAPRAADGRGLEDEETVRRLTDLVMERLIDGVEELRGEVAVHQQGAPRAD